MDNAKSDAVSYGKPLRILVACEYSATVREAFRARGHEAWSCDLLPSEKPGSHYTGDVLEFVRKGPYLFDDGGWH